MSVTGIQKDQHGNLQQAQCVLVPHFKKHENQEGKVQAKWTKKNNHDLGIKRLRERMDVLM